MFKATLSSKEETVDPCVKQLVIGCKGQVGSALYSVLANGFGQGNLSGMDIDVSPTETEKFGVLHICIPYCNAAQFTSTVQDYRDKYLQVGGLLIIHSSVPIGTSRQLNAVHSPIRGVHPNLAEGICTFVKFFGGPRADEACRLFGSIGLRCIATQKAETTEALKLWDTTYYGWNIVFEKAVKQYCDEHELDFSVVYTLSNATYNEGYTQLGKGDVSRPVLADMPGKIGGHCVIPNARLLESPVSSFILNFDAKETNV